MNKSKKGSALGAALVVALCMTLVLAGLLRWTEAESRLTRQHQLNAKADYGAEATGEFALAQINSELQQTPIVTAAAFTPAGAPPAQPDPGMLSGTLSSLLHDLGGNDNNGSGGGGLVENVIDLLGGLLGGGGGSNGNQGNSTGDGNGAGDGNGNNPAPTAPAARFLVSSENLVVSEFSPIRPQFIDPANPLYADDPLRGQTVNVRELRVYSAARATDMGRGESAAGYCEHILQMRDTPIFGFIAFYNMDLEVHPGATMDLAGPVHANGNLYVGSGAGLNLRGVVTSANGIYHGRAPNSGMTTDSGDVTFTGPNGTQVSMNQSAGWVDSTSSTWGSDALNLWSSNVLNSDHGVGVTMPAAIPSYTPDDPSTPQNELVNDAHNLIEPAVTNNGNNFAGNNAEIQKFASKASLVIEVKHTVLPLLPATMNVKVYKYVPDANGTYVRETANGIGTFKRVELSAPSGLVTNSSFYDGRQAQTVRAADLDIGVLKTLIENDSEAAKWTKSGQTFSPATEWNGVVYVEHENPTLNSTNLGAVRLVNGQSLPNRPTASNSQQSGLTVATNAPLYIRGNYNADGTIPAEAADIVEPEAGEPPAAVVADAVTLLSNSWTDANSTQGISSRKATPTEVAAAITTGLVPTNKNGNGTYSGGLENFVRFLEDWDNIKVGLRSSLVVMFESEAATKPWPGTGGVYKAPKRVFGLNRLFVEARNPPGTPNTRTYRRIGYRKMTLEEYNSAIAGLNSN